MKCKDIMKKIEARYPTSYALSWDNVGLLVGDPYREVKRIYIALDATEEVLADAVKKEADMLWTHHPLLFAGIKRVHTGDLVGRKIYELIRHEMVCYASHTNYDVMGMAALAAEKLELKEPKVLEETMEGEGIGRIGQLPHPMTLLECCDYVKAALGLPNVKAFGNLSAMVTQAAISPGSGKSMIAPALQADVDVLITGDIDHHTGIDAVDAGLAIIDAGHYGTEYMFVEDACRFIQEHCEGVEVFCQRTCQPFTVV